jgi:hypothetical protein
MDIAAYIDLAGSQNLRLMLADLPRQLRTIASRSINKAAAGANSRLVDAVCDRLNLRPSEVRSRNTSRTSATREDLRAEVKGFGRRIPLKRFSARATAAGVSYRISPEDAREAAHAFLAAMGSGYGGVFMRVEAQEDRRRRRGGRGSPRLAGRLPIRELWGPSVPQVANTSEELSDDVLEPKLTEAILDEMDRQAALALQGQAGYAA